MNDFSSSPLKMTKTTTLTLSQKISQSITPVSVCQNLPFDRYERTCVHLQRQLAVYRLETNIVQIYRLGLGFVSLVEETMKKHRAWRENEMRFQRWQREAEDVCGELETLKGEINALVGVEKYSHATSTFKTMKRPPPVAREEETSKDARVVAVGSSVSSKSSSAAAATMRAVGAGTAASTSSSAASRRTEGAAAKSGKHSLLSGEVITEKVKGLDIGVSSNSTNNNNRNNNNTGASDASLGDYRSPARSLMDDEIGYGGYGDGALKPSTPPPPPHLPVPPSSSYDSYDYVPSAGSIEFRPSVVLQHAQKPPSSSAASLDHLKLDKRLELYGLKEFIVNGDGNCQFRAISDQLYGDQSHHASVRAVVIGQMRARPDRYAAFVESPSDDNQNDTTTELANYHAYLRNMSKPGSWGDHVTLQAASDAFGLPFCVITSYRDNFVLEIQPEKRKHHQRVNNNNNNEEEEKVLWISFWSEVHYNSLYPIDSSKFST